MTNQKSIVVWSKEGCSYCDEVKNYLQQHQLPFQVVDVTTQDAFRDVLNIKYGVRHVPVVEIGDGQQYIGVTDVGIEHLEKALAAQQVIQ